MRRRLPLLCAATLLASCSDEPEVSQANPRISVCRLADPLVPAEACDRPHELGELPITWPHELPLLIRSVGVVTLEVSGFTGTDDWAVEASLPLRLAPGQDRALSTSFVPSALGPASARLEIASDDRTQQPYVVEVRYVGVPAPAPRIELCREDGVCGPSISVDLGLVRRTQAASHRVTVKNLGDASLELLGVQRRGSSSQPGELTVLTSTGPGTLEPGGAAPLLLVYEPQDGVLDRFALEIRSNDASNPTATIDVAAGSPDNFPPIASVIPVGTSTASVRLLVGDWVGLDGSASRDPEGDPLVYAWTLAGPARSRVELTDPTAGAVAFTPDVAGEYRVTLEVVDALGQPSAPVTVLVEALPRFALKAILEWEQGGDLDLHLLQAGGQLFGDGACYYEAPNPSWGDPNRRDDDPELVEDAEAAPGYEEIRLAAPADGTYEVYVHYFDEGGAGAAEATVSIVFDDASAPAATVTQTLAETCGLWHVGSLSFPDGSFTPSADPIALLCP